MNPIRFRTSLRNTVYDVMKSRNWNEVQEDEEWDFFWADVHWIFDCFDITTFTENQKINHFRNHYEVFSFLFLIKWLINT